MRISALVALSSVIQVAVSLYIYTLDQPDIPLLLNSTGFIINIVLDLLFISKFYISTFKPTILIQAGIRLVCNIISAITSLYYFVYISTKMQQCIYSSQEQDEIASQFKLKALIVLVHPVVYTFTESVIYNSIYL